RDTEQASEFLEWIGAVVDANVDVVIGGNRRIVGRLDDENTAGLHATSVATSALSTFKRRHQSFCKLTLRGLERFCHSLHHSFTAQDVSLYRIVFAFDVACPVVACFPRVRFHAP